MDVFPPKLMTKVANSFSFPQLHVTGTILYLLFCFFSTWFSILWSQSMICLFLLATFHSSPTWCSRACLREEGSHQRVRIPQIYFFQMYANLSKNVWIVGSVILGQLGSTRKIWQKSVHMDWVKCRQMLCDFGQLNNGQTCLDCSDTFQPNSADFLFLKSSIERGWKRQKQITPTITQWSLSTTFHPDHWSGYNIVDSVWLKTKISNFVTPPFKLIVLRETKMIFQNKQRKKQ